MKKTFVILGATVIATLSTACATLGRSGFQEPIVNFRDLQVEGVGTKGGTVDVILSVYNPNGYRLDATQLNYRLLVDTSMVGQGTYNTHFAVQSGDSTMVKLPVNLSYAGLASAAKMLRERGSVDYRVLGDVTVGTPIGNFTKPFDKTCRFSSLQGAQHC